jgi:DNA-directed RNA polymerase subunit K/omega
MARTQLGADGVDLHGEMDLGKMIARGENKYLMVNLLARRARELNDGARPLVRLPQAHSVLELAIAEGLGDGLKVIKREKEKVVVDLVDRGD